MSDFHSSNLSFSGKSPHGPDCWKAREALHAVWDGELGPAESDVLAAHLAHCPSCRRAADELAELRSALSGLNPLPFPAKDLERVWEATIGQAPPVPADRALREQHLLLRPTSGRPRRWLRPALAAAALAAVMALVFFIPRTVEPKPPTPAELARAEAQVRWVLGLTDRSLNHTQQVAATTVNRTLRTPMARIPVLKSYYPDSTTGRN